MAHNTIEFGPYRLEDEADRLWRGEERIPLRPKATRMLSYLARRPGRLVTKDELRQQVWNAAEVSDTTVRVAAREIRAALGDDRDGSAYLETVAGRGYRFLGGADAALDRGSEKQRKARTLSPKEEWPIVGRQREVEYLLNRFFEASKGRRRLVFLGGEPGAGKTTLVRLFLERLQGRPETTLASGQSVMSFGAGEAYGPVLDALGRMGQEAEGGALVRLLDRCAPMWLAQLPALVEPEKREQLSRSVEGATRERMVRELNDALERLTHGSTLVLVLEDLHWSDVATIELLAGIGERREPARLMVLGTYRPADAVVQAPALRSAMRELQARGLCEQLDLELLGKVDIAAFLADRLGGEPSEEVVDLIFRRSGGNPLFMVNVLEHLLENQAIRQRDRRWTVDTSDPALRRLPRGLRPFIQRRLDDLSGDERKILEVASVAGVEFAGAVLAARNSQADGPPDLEHVEAILDSRASRGRQLIANDGVVEWPDGTLSAQYRFRHALYREGLYEQIPELRRARLHGRVGQCLEAAFGSQAADIAPALAIHFEQGLQWEAAARFRRAAGERALGRHAYHEAVVHLRKALVAFGKLGAKPAEADPDGWLRWELDVNATLGTTLIAVKGYSDPELESIHLRALELSERLADPALQMPALYSFCMFHLVRGDLRSSRDSAVRMSRVAADVGSDDLRLMADSAQSQVELFRGEIVDSAKTVAAVLTVYDPELHHSLAEAYGGDDPGVAGLGQDSWRLWLEGYPDRALNSAQESLSLAERLGGPYNIALAGIYALATLQFRGDSSELDVRASALQTTSTDHGFELFRAWAVVFQGWLEAAKGDGASEATRTMQGLEAWRSTGARLATPYLMTLVVESHLHHGRVEAAEEWLARAQAQVERSDERWWEAEVQRLEGEVLLATAESPPGEDTDPGAAEACFERAISTARRQGARSLELRAALSLSRLSSHGESTDASRRLSALLDGFTEGHDTRDLRAAREHLASLSSAK